MPNLETVKKSRPRPKSKPVTVTDRVLRIDAALELTGLRRWMFNDKRKNDSRFPPDTKLGKRAVGWSEAALRDYVALLAKEGGSK